MNLQVNLRRLSALGWMVVFFLILLLTGNDLCGLQNRPLVGLSGEARMVKLKLKQLENAVLQRSQAITGDMRMLLAHYSPAGTSEDSPFDNEPQMEESSYEAPIQLPKLTGIMQRVDHRGQQSYIAVFNNQFCRKNDIIDGFRVSFISPQGIELIRSGQKWFLACPTAHYSMDAGN
jgi:hypothetical protein